MQVQRLLLLRGNKTAFLTLGVRAFSPPMMNGGVPKLSFVELTAKLQEKKLDIDYDHERDSRNAMLNWR